MIRLDSELATTFPDSDPLYGSSVRPHGFLPPMQEFPQITRFPTVLQVWPSQIHSLHFPLIALSACPLSQLVFKDHGKIFFERISYCNRHFLLRVSYPISGPVHARLHFRPKQNGLLSRQSFPYGTASLPETVSYRPKPSLPHRIPRPSNPSSKRGVSQGPSN